METGSALEPFQKLLNNLNHELNERNLESLIHICGKYIPGCQRERIFSGWDVFIILRHQNVIGNGREQIHNLLEIIKELRPKRRDLVSMVKQYIQDCYENPETILEDLQSSWDCRQIQLPLTSDRCCCGCSCNCDACCNACCSTCCISCSVVLVFLFSILAIVASLAWYSNIPKLTKYLKSDDDRKQAGPCVIGILIFLALSSFVCAIYVKYCGRRNAGQYEVLEDIPRTLNIQESST